MNYSARYKFAWFFGVFGFIGYQFGIKAAIIFMVWFVMGFACPAFDKR